MGKPSVFVLLAAVLSVGGCAHLRDSHGNAVSLRAYDCVLIDSVECGPSVSRRWVGPALRESLQQGLGRSRHWEPSSPRPGRRELKLRVTIIAVGMASELRPCGSCSSCGASCRVVVYEAASGRALASADLSASCARAGPCADCAGGGACRPSGRQHFRRAVIPQLAAKVLAALRQSKTCSPQWESGVMGCGC